MSVATRQYRIVGGVTEGHRPGEFSSTKVARSHASILALARLPGTRATNIDRRYIRRALPASKTAALHYFYTKPRKYYSEPGYRASRYPGRTFCFEICDPLSHMSVLCCICNFFSNVSRNTLPGGAR